MNVSEQPWLDSAIASLTPGCVEPVDRNTIKEQLIIHRLPTVMYTHEGVEYLRAFSEHGGYPLRWIDTGYRGYCPGCAYDIAAEYVRNNLNDPFPLLRVDAIYDASAYSRCYECEQELIGEQDDD